MSLGETQQIFILLNEINNLLDAIDAKCVTTEVKLNRVTTQAIMTTQILTKISSIMRRLGLPEDVERALMKLQRLISIANQLRLVIHATNAAMAGTPGGALIAGLGLLMMTLDVGDIMMGSG